MSLWLAHPKRVALLLSAAMFAIPAVLVLLVPRPLEQPFGVDFLLYRDAAARWLAGGPYFEPYQLAGPYPITAGDVLYPPVALWLFVPFTVLPAVLWWAIPIARHRLGRLAPPARAGVVAAHRAVRRLADDAAQDLDRQPGHLERGGDGARGRLLVAVRVRAAQAQPLPVRPVRGEPPELVDRAGGLRRRCACRSGRCGPTG